MYGLDQAELLLEEDEQGASNMGLLQLPAAPGQGSQPRKLRRPRLANIRRAVAAHLPWPLAIVSGMLVGALVFLATSSGPAYSEVRRYNSKGSRGKMSQKVS
jgi:hypothetical protein